MEITIKSVDYNFLVAHALLMLTFDFFVELRRLAFVFMVKEPYVVILHPKRNKELLDIFEELDCYHIQEGFITIVGMGMLYSKACCMDEVIVMSQKDYEENQWLEEWEKEANKLAPKK